MEDLVSFLGSHPPFDAMQTQDVARVAAVTEIECYPAGKTIFSEGTGPVTYVWVVRTGSVEIVHDGRLRLLARLALSFRPPTGFLRDFVVEHSGERKGQLDIKHGGLIPIIDLARWAGIAAGVASASTAERLRAAEAAGTLESSEARALAEAFDFIAIASVQSGLATELSLGVRWG